MALFSRVLRSKWSFEIGYAMHENFGAFTLWVHQSLGRLSGASVDNAIAHVGVGLSSMWKVLISLLLFSSIRLNKFLILYDLYY